MFNQECSLKVVKKHSDIQNVTHVTHCQNICIDISDIVTVCHTVKNSVTKSDILTSDFIKNCGLNVTLFSFKNNLKHYKINSDILSDMSRFVTAEKYKNIISNSVTTCDIFNQKNTTKKNDSVTTCQCSPNVDDIYPYIYKYIYIGGIKTPLIYIFTYIKGKKLGRQNQKNSKKISAEKIKNSVCKILNSDHHDMITCGGHHAV